MRSGIWLNLHHCLYGQARRLLRQAQQEHHPDELSTKTLPQTHGDAWAQAVNYYLENLAVHDLLRSPEMRLLKWSLAELPDAQQPSLETVPKGLAAQLIASRSVYEQTWWEQQQHVNVSYIKTVKTFTVRYGPPLAQRISRAFQTSWPTETLLVDIVYWARWSGAYTTLKPNHLVISSSALGNQELAALEVLFHEASHTLFGPGWGVVSEMVGRLCARHQREEPRDLWHAIMFYTVGILVQQVLAEAGSKAYVPYADKQELYQRVPGWQAFRQAFATHWLPYLEGDAEFGEALERVVLAVAAPAA